MLSDISTLQILAPGVILTAPNVELQLMIVLLVQLGFIFQGLTVCHALWISVLLAPLLVNAHNVNQAFTLKQMEAVYLALLLSHNV